MPESLWSETPPAGSKTTMEASSWKRPVPIYEVRHRPGKQGKQKMISKERILDRVVRDEDEQSDDVDVS